MRGVFVLHSSIDKRLLECGLNQDDEAHGPLASLAKRRGGSAPFVSPSTASILKSRPVT